ncbi:methionyl-tRNA formyltransferase [Balneicella halophila]|uniref:Methionyl-tRNA formyltransferase n=1 Tax=Balneicella halophila TaxID=1537566 RepID=A0A7L4URP3_BALHA|nr:methionyl-tRNA formyltransferase [Balneicella halophila]PVX52172.1 methionyl-tRNA formyltransferase [Balneicella halophila]
MKEQLRIVYMGTPDFAVAPLVKLLNAGCNIVGVVTNLDKPAGRGQRIVSSPVKQFAEKKGLPILQPHKFRDEQFLRDLRAWNADLQIVVAFKMLPEVVWSMPTFGTVNLHASLLPQYRGAAPINHAIINGEKTTGVTTFLLQKEIDTGNILLQKEVAIDVDETAGTLHDKLMDAGSDLLVETVDLITSGKYEAKPQPKVTNLKTAPKIFKEDCRIDWDVEGQFISNFIRGLSPYPGAWTTLNSDNKTVNLKIYECKFESAVHQHGVGDVVSDGKTNMKVAVKGGFIAILKLQQAGKKALDIEAFLRGFKLSNNAVLA